MTKCFHTASLASCSLAARGERGPCFDWSLGGQPAASTPGSPPARGRRQVTQHIHSQNPKHNTGPCSLCALSLSLSLSTLIQGRAGQPGADGGQGPKGSRVSLHCPLNPALARSRFRRSLDIPLCLCSLTAGGTGTQRPLGTRRPRREQPLSLA